MKKLFRFSVPLFMLAIVVLSCTSKDKSEGRFLRTKTLKKGLYLECYEMAKGGVFSGNTYGYYLTDSNRYLQFIGFVGDNEVVDYHFENDSSVIFFTTKTIDSGFPEGVPLKKIKLPKLRYSEDEDCPR